MLCLKAEVLDDQDPTIDTNNASGSGGGFVLPINLGGSIHKYLWKMGKVSNRYAASGDGCSSISEFEDTKSLDRRSGQLKGGNVYLYKCHLEEDDITSLDRRSGELEGGTASLYKCQLEEDVKRLQRQLEDEITLRLALATAVEHSDSNFSSSPCQLPDKAQELLDSLAILDITVSKLEQESISLQYLISQERNERRLAEYRMRHLPSPVSSLFSSSQTHLTEQLMGPCGEAKVKRGMGDKSPWPVEIGDPNKDYFIEKVQNHPNRLSEEMVLCMRDIYLFLADPSRLSSSEYAASPSSPQGHLSYSSLASISDSPLRNSLMKSPSTDAEHDSDVLARNCKFDPYRVSGKVNWTESIGTYGTALEVSWLSVGKKELEYASGALKRFRLLVEQLADVVPSCLSCNEKLAFWINVYNALIMHAFLAYGIPGSDIKLFSLMQKAAYTVGGHSFSAADIEYIILKMKPPAHRPQIALVLALQKFKVTDEQKRYCIDQPEPLLAFALSCGMHSSPAVRIFTPENVNELLQVCLKDYVQASVGISSKGKLLVPKLLSCFAKGIVEDALLPEWICQFLSTEQASLVRDCSTNQKWRLLGSRSFSVVPFDSRFRFLFIL